MKCNVIRAALLVFVATLLGGCSCAGPTARPVIVSLDPELHGAQFRPIEVDLVFVQENEVPRWDAKSMLDYFGGGDIMRRDERRKQTIVFNSGGPTQTTFGATQEELNRMGQWIQEGATHMYVMARLPDHEKIGALTGPSDPRRQCLPLSQCAWDEADVDQSDVRIDVRRGSIVVTPGITCGR